MPNKEEELKREERAEAESNFIKYGLKVPNYKLSKMEDVWYDINE